MRMRLEGAGWLKLLVVPAIFVLASCSSSSDSSPTGSPLHLVVPGTSPPSDDAGDSVAEAARGFADALHQKKYDELWSLLSAHAQQSWPDEQTFESFLGRKFGARDMTLTIGDALTGSDGSSAVVQVGLTGGASDYQSSLKLERHDNKWLVVDPGPLGKDGPIIDDPINSATALNQLSVPILTYHHVAPELPAAPGDDRNNTVTNAAFDEQLSWLVGNGYQSITIAELFNAFHYGLPLPSKPIILVFDDGYEDVYMNAFPLLKQHNFGATLAVITGAVDQSGYLTWDQLHEMNGAGLEIVSHTVTHPDLGVLAPEAARSEIAQSRKTLEDRLGRPMQFLVYPYGQPFASGSEAAQANVLAMLHEEGYAGALTTSSGPPYISLQEAAMPYQLHRIPVSGGEILARFIASIGGTP